MTFTLEFFVFLIWTGMTAVFRCNADRLPPPTMPQYKWLDPFIVNLSWSWERPSGLPHSCQIQFEAQPQDSPTQSLKRVQMKHFTDIFLTEEAHSDHWTYNIHAVITNPCDGWNDSISVPITIHTRQPRAEVVKDFRCLLDPSGMNCSWIPVNQSLNMSFSYRVYGRSEELIKGLKRCAHPYSSGARNGYYLKIEPNKTICISVCTEAGCGTFTPLLAVPSPKLSINQEGGHLYLNWTPPEVGGGCDWIYEFCFTQCNEHRECQNVTVARGEMHATRVHYNERCLYKFQSRVFTSKYCPAISSDFSEVVTYGVNVPPDMTGTVVAIVIPIVLSVCLILSCYCFRRHRSIICPIIPDPSAIFKELVINGNKEHKNTTGRLYIPGPEAIDPCKIILVKENGDPQQTS
uniref:interleukin-13 receptor subunit alpha-1-like n=1 Tax=Monopterus albus TaxID=43700 RepID=UPI0009B3D634|nr:interleukin-13 receptor subunit alpha-1-like [Monopterus albus]